MKEKAVMCWSGGKDSALSLYRASDKYEIVSLLTTVNSYYQRSSMHGVRVELLRAQAESIGLPLDIAYVDRLCTNKEYNNAMNAHLTRHRDDGTTKVIYGDIFLEDLRRWRQKSLDQIAMRPVFPLWGEDTGKLASEFISLGFKAIVCCVSDKRLKEEHVGRLLDDRFLNSLPGVIDPCGENGEYHSFVFDGPIFENPVALEVGKKVYRPLESHRTCKSADPTGKTEEKLPDGLWFCDIRQA